MSAPHTSIWSDQILAGRTIIIVGASSGIGEATARLAGRLGATVGLVGRDERRLSDIRSDLQGTGVDAVLFTCDVRDARAVNEAAFDALIQLGQIDALVYSAGVGQVAPVATIRPEQIETMMAVNYTGAVRWTKALLPTFIEAGFGDIVIVASDGAFRAYPGWAGYCASKHAIRGFAASLALETAGSGVRVSTVCPGAVNTPFWDGENVPTRSDRDVMIPATAVADVILTVLTAPRGVTIPLIEIQPTL